MAERLVFLSGPRHGESVAMDQASTTVGRADGCDVVIDDPYVSREHARITMNQGHTIVEDLSSTSGTKVNGRLCRQPIILHDGDVLKFAEVEARWESAENPTQIPPVPALLRETGEPPTTSVGNSASYTVENLQAGTMNQVAGSQFNVWAQQRESFLREIAATKTRARYAVWTGVAVWVVGMAIAAFGWFKYAHNIMDFSSTPPSQGPTERWFFVFAAGGLVNAIGIIIIIIGIVLHIVAASRRRQYRVQTMGVGPLGTSR